MLVHTLLAGAEVLVYILPVGAEILVHIVFAGVDVLTCIFTIYAEDLQHPLTNAGIYDLAINL